MPVNINITNDFLLLARYVPNVLRSERGV